MTRTIYLVVLLFLLPYSVTLLAQQNDSLRNEILNRPDSDLEMILKGRSLTLEHLQKGDLYALKEVKEYLAHETGNPYNAYLPVEYWLLSFWTEEYDILLQEAKEFSTGIDWQNNGNWVMPEKFHPSSLLIMVSNNDRLSRELGKKSAESYLPLTFTIDNTDLNKEEKEFLRLLLYGMLFSPQDVENGEEMAELNQMATDFLKTYKGSEYADYTRRFIRYHFKPSNWGFGYEFFVGYNAFTGGISRHFSNNMSAGFAFNALYRDLYLSLRINYAGTKTKQEITKNNTSWPTDVRGYLAGADLALHYPLYQSRDFRLMPFIGIGGMGIGPTDTEIDKQPDLKNMKEFSTFNYLAGLELQLNSWDQEVDLTSTGGLYLGIRYTYYMPNYKRKYDALEGNMHMITISIGGFGRPMKRHY